MNNKDICPDFEDDFITRNGKRRTVCSYWDIDNPGMCNHKSHNVCLIYIAKNNITDQFLIDLMQEFSLVLEKDIR